MKEPALHETPLPTLSEIQEVFELLQLTSEEERIRALRFGTKPIERPAQQYFEIQLGAGFPQSK